MLSWSSVKLGLLGLGLSLTKVPAFTVTKTTPANTPLPHRLSFLPSVMVLLTRHSLCCLICFLRNEIVDMVSVYQVLSFYWNETPPWCWERGCFLSLRCSLCVSICPVIWVRKSSLCPDYSRIIRLEIAFQFMSLGDICLLF